MEIERNAEKGTMSLGSLEIGDTFFLVNDKEQLFIVVDGEIRNTERSVVSLSSQDIGDHHMIAKDRKVFVAKFKLVEVS